MIAVAAVRVNGQIVVPCLRHYQGREIVKAFTGGAGVVTVEEGFVTNDGAFLSPVEAYNHAITCGQVPATIRHLKALQHDEALHCSELF